MKYPNQWAVIKLYVKKELIKGLLDARANARNFTLDFLEFFVTTTYSSGSHIYIYIYIYIYTHTQ